MYRTFFKRFFDILLSACALLVLSPVILVTAVLVRWKLGSPVIFCQERPGKGEKIFKMYKFRSMTDQRDAEGNLLPDEVRLTKFGRILRSTSLDELPELGTILKGDMSSVGPRPQLVRDMVFMTPDQRLRHTVRPGLTGLAQVSGRNALRWDIKLAYDLEYIRDITFLNDCRILWRTVTTVFKREGIGADGEDLAEDYGDYLLRVGRVSEEDYHKGQMQAKELLLR